MILSVHERRLRLQATRDANTSNLVPRSNGQRIVPSVERMPITEQESVQVAAIVGPIFDQVTADYDFSKYPAADYLRFKNSFSSLDIENHDIEDSLLWKWGHWGKPNYPQKHRDLIAEIQALWPRFVSSGSGDSSRRTFDWWSQQLNKPTRYISVAYMTHLVHYTEPLPMIDQHNYRAMNSLLGAVRPLHSGKKKPSQWADIVELKQFMTSILHWLEDLSFEELDRFLMMYGKHCARR